MLARYFAKTTDLTLDMSAAAQVFRVLRAESLYASYGELVGEQGNLIGENVINNVLDAQKLSLTETAAADAAHTKIYRRFQLLFDDVDALICPATAV